MNILMIAPFAEGLLAESYAHAFEKFGIRILQFDSDRAYYESIRFGGNKYIRRIMKPILWNKMNYAALFLARSIKPDLLIAFKTPFLHTNSIIKIKNELKVPFINYYPDNPYCGVPIDPRKTSAQRRDIVKVLKNYTRVWIWERTLVDRLRGDNVNADYLPFGVDEIVYKPFGKQGEFKCPECGIHHDIVFIGQHSKKRELHLDAVRKHSVAIWGKRWKRAARRFSGRHIIHNTPIFGSDCARFYSSVYVSLNILDDLNMPGHNMRTFEIPASGGLMLATHTQEQSSFFPEDEAAVYYRKPEELDEKISKILGNRDFQRGVRKRAFESSKSHSYTERAKVILSDLGLPTNL